MLLFMLLSKKILGFYQIRLKTEKLTHTIAINAKITQFFNNGKLRGKFSNRIIA